MRIITFCCLHTFYTQDRFFSQLCAIPVSSDGRLREVIKMQMCYRINDFEFYNLHK